MVKEGGTTYTFVTDGLDATLARAREAAGDRDVVVLGGADVIQQCLKGGLLDELHIHLAHVLLGGGPRLFGDLDTASATFECKRVIDAEGVTHLRFRVSAGPICDGRSIKPIWRRSGPIRITLKTTKQAFCMGAGACRSDGSCDYCAWRPVHLPAPFGLSSPARCWLR